MARRTPQPTLTPEQKAESDRIFAALQQAAVDDLRALAGQEMHPLDDRVLGLRTELHPVGDEGATPVGIEGLGCVGVGMGHRDLDGTPIPPGSGS